MDDRRVTPLQPGPGAPWPVPTAESRRLFERANLVPPGRIDRVIDATAAFLREHRHELAAP